MNRRDWAVGAAYTAFAGLTASQLPSSASAAASAVGVWDKVVEKAAHCITKSLACEAHCQTMLGRGESHMAACSAAVREVLVACEAVMRLAAHGSKHAKVYAAACADVCEACAGACEKHKSMPVCRACMDSCLACAKACRDALAS